MRLLSSSGLNLTRHLHWSFALLGLLSFSFSAQAQKPVYRCETAGKVSYSDAPCVGAKEIDTTPTQGMDKMTGASRKGADVQRAEHNALMADALKPLTSMTCSSGSITANLTDELPQLMTKIILISYLDERGYQ